MKIPVTVEIPDEIMQDSLTILAEKNGINLAALNQQQQIEAVAQAVTNTILLSIAGEIGRRKGKEERARIEQELLPPKVVWPAPDIIPSAEQSNVE